MKSVSCGEMHSPLLGDRVQSGAQLLSAASGDRRADVNVPLEVVGTRNAGGNPP